MTTNSGEIFKSIMSNDNDIRKNAEETIQNQKNLPFNEALNFFMEGINNSDEKISQMAALLFKKTFLEDERFLKSLNTETAENLVNQIFYPLVSHEKNWKFLERIAENIAKLYTVADLKNSLNQIVLLFGNENPIIRQFAIFLLDATADLNLIKEEVVISSIDHFKDLFSKGLQDNDSKVRILTLKAATTLLSNIKQEKLVLEFSSLTKLIINSLIYCLQNDTDGTKSKSMLETLNNLCDYHPKLWKQDLDSFIGVICEILSSELPRVLKQSTFQLILSFSKSTPAYLRKSEVFKMKFVPLLMHLLKDLDNLNDLENWTTLNEDNDNDLDELHYAAREGIELCALDLGAKFFLDLVNPIISNYLMSSDWIEVHAAFVCISWLSEPCSKNFKSDLQNLLNFISHGLQHSNPRVRHSALSALASICEGNKPKIQQEYHSNVLPALAKMIADEKENLRVRIHAVSCLVSFLKGLVNETDEEEVDDYSDIIKPYSKDLLALMASTFNFSITINNATLQEIVLSAISMIATILDNEFEPFYNDIIPFLKDLLIKLISTRKSENKNLIAEIISTVSFICSSVHESSEKHMTDFNDFCALFEKLLTILKEEDPEVIAIFKAFSHLSTSMKTSFYPYLERLFPILQTYALADIDIKLEDVDYEKVLEEKFTPGLILQSGGVNKKLSLKTFTLQNKVMAIDVLKDICLNMGTSFYPYNEKFLEIIRPVINALYSRKLRKIAAQSFEAAIYTCQEPSQQKLICDFIFEDFLTKYEKDLEVKMIRDIKSNLKIFIHAFTEVKSNQVINTELIKKLFVLLQKTVALMEEKKEGITLLAKKEDAFDEMDEGGFTEDIEILNEVSRRVMELSGVLFKIFKVELTQLVVSHLYSLFLQILNKAVKETKNDQEIVFGLCFLTDILQYSDQDTFNKVGIEFMEICKNILTKNEDIVQNIVFGYGIFVERSHVDQYLPYANLISTTVSSIITRKLNEENRQCYDNGIATLGKILYFKTQNNEEGLELAKSFYDKLPLKYDLDESKASIKLLCNQFLAGNPLVNNQKFHSSFRKIFINLENLEDKEAVVDDEVKALVNSVVSQLSN